MKKLIMFSLITFSMFCMLVMVHAENTTKDFRVLDRQKDIVLMISWDTEKPYVAFIAPDGTLYDPNVENSSTEVILKDKSMFYIIHGAQQGQWKITYDKKSNANVSVALEDYQETFMITEFDLGALNGDYLPVTFNTQYSTDQSYNYTLSAVIEKQGEEKTVATGTAYANSPVEVQANLSQLASYSNYMLKLYVYFPKNGADVFDFAYSDPFAYTNPNTPQTSGDLGVTIDPDQYSLDISWANLSWNAERCLVGVFADDGAEPAFFSDYDPSANSTSTTYDPAAKKLRVQLSVKYNGLYASPLIKTIDLASAPSLMLDKAEATSKPQLALTYKGFQDCLATLTVNEKQDQLHLSGDGQLSVKLDDDWNSVLLQYTDNDGITWVHTRKVFVDRTPPILNIFENYNGISTDDTQITLIGSVLDCSTLTIGGQPVTFNADGSFSYDAPLKDGLNNIDIVAADAVGNQALYQAVITKNGGIAKAAGNAAGTGGKSPLSGFVPLFASLGIALILFTLALIFWKRKEGPNEQQ